MKFHNNYRHKSSERQTNLSMTITSFKQKDLKCTYINLLFVFFFFFVICFKGLVTNHKELSGVGITQHSNINYQFCRAEKIILLTHHSPMNSDVTGMETTSEKFHTYKPSSCFTKFNYAFCTSPIQHEALRRQLKEVGSVHLIITTV